MVTLEHYNLHEHCTVCTLGSKGFSNAKNLLPPLRRNSEKIEKKLLVMEINTIIIINLILLAFKIELHHASSILLSTISHYSEYLSGQQWAKWKGEGLGIDMHCRCQLVDQKKN